MSFWNDWATGRAIRDATRALLRYVLPIAGALYLLAFLIHALGGPCMRQLHSDLENKLGRVDRSNNTRTSDEVPPKPPHHGVFALSIVSSNSAALSDWPVAKATMHQISKRPRRSIVETLTSRLDTRDSSFVPPPLSLSSLDSISNSVSRCGIHFRASQAASMAALFCATD